MDQERRGLFDRIQVNVLIKVKTYEREMTKRKNTTLTQKYYQVKYTVEPALKDRPIGHKNMVSQDRWSLVTGSVALKCGTFCQEYVVCQDRWSFMTVVSQDRFHCTEKETSRSFSCLAC